MNEIFLKEHADGVVTPQLFGCRTKPVPYAVEDGFDAQKVPKNHILVKLLALSVDPYMRSRMTPPGPGYLREFFSFEFFFRKYFLKIVINNFFKNKNRV